MVLTFDAAGLIMKYEALRPATRKDAAKAAESESSGERPDRRAKRDRKPMAEVAAIYTVERFPRTVMDVGARFDVTLS